mmetsp:Transcript_33208/g.66061  ORF Transcript_33208/g.66061 Transcript_33208/m.66061 type:complete len:236 (-) Transcript_33208:49-756(-)
MCLGHERAVDLLMTRVACRVQFKIGSLRLDVQRDALGREQVVKLLVLPSEIGLASMRQGQVGVACGAHPADRGEDPDIIAAVEANVVDVHLAPAAVLPILHKDVDCRASMRGQTGAIVQEHGVGVPTVLGRAEQIVVEVIHVEATVVGTASALEPDVVDAIRKLNRVRGSGSHGAIRTDLEELLTGETIGASTIATRVLVHDRCICASPAGRAGQELVFLEVEGRAFGLAQAEEG